MALNLTYALLPFSDFYDRILPEIPGYQRSLVDQELRSAAIDFCKATRVWQETVTDTIKASVVDYDLDYPSEAIFHEIREVLVDGVPIAPFTPAELSREQPQWRLCTGPVTAYHSMNMTGLSLFAIPDCDHSLEVDAVFVPSESCTRLPDFLFERYVGVIAKSAKARLMVMGKKPWTDRDLAMKYESDVSSQTGSIAMKIALGNTRLPPRVAVNDRVRD